MTSESTAQQHTRIASAVGGKNALWNENLWTYLVASSCILERAPSLRLGRRRASGGQVYEHAPVLGRRRDWARGAVALEIEQQAAQPS